MRILIVHNAYGKYSGEEAVVDGIQTVLEKHGHKVTMFRRSSEELASSSFGTVHGFIGGFYSRSGIKGLREALERDKPDVVNVHNVFPLISPAALRECKRAGVPVVMTIHNFRLICPTGLFMRNGKPCEECLRRGNEWSCVRHNCEASLPKSVGYALRNFVARKTRAFVDNVDVFSCITDFQREKLVAAGFPEQKIRVNPNFFDVTEAPKFSQGSYVAYCGRLSYEKGYDLLIEAARKLPDVEFRFAGSVRAAEALPELPNVKYLGHISGENYLQFVRDARFIVMPSRCYEGFPMSILEAAAQGKPCIGPRHGGFVEIIGEGEAAIGRMFAPNDVEELTEQIKVLWNRPESVQLLGEKAFHKLQNEYGSEQFYERFVTICRELVVNF